jgi:predicted nucleic acid-binding protein
MDLVMDANVLFSILIKKGKTEELLFRESLNIFAPEFMFEEFEKHAELILMKTKRTRKEFNELMRILKKRIKTIPNKETDDLFHEAKRICPDRDDADYFAIAMKKGCALWSNDKVLKKQNIVKVYSTTDLMKEFGMTSTAPE